MKSNYPAAILSNFDGDKARAYEHLSKAYLSLEKQHIDESGSRFIEISRFEQDGEICVRKKTESQISSDVDMADCIDPGVMRKWFYVADDGELQPVTIGPQERWHGNAIEQPFHFAGGAILAGGKVVGQVVYTDH